MVRRTPDDEIVYLLDRHDLTSDTAADQAADRIRELLGCLHITPSTAARATVALDLYDSRRRG